MLVRGFAALLAYVVGLSAMIGVGAIGMMALQSPPSDAPAVAASHKERPAKPVKQTTAAQTNAQPSPKRKVALVTRKRKENEGASPISSAFSTYGYAQEPHRFYQYPVQFFGR
jgi:hypothetical protein